MGQRTHVKGENYRQAPDLRDKILAAVIVSAGGCWLWTRSISQQGYGNIFYRRGPNTHIRLAVHRLAYMQWVGDPGDEMVLDHTCHDPVICQLGDECPHRRCCNPAHLKPVTWRENLERSSWRNKTHCVNGHEYTPENTKFLPSGWRTCRECHRADAHRRYATPEGKAQKREQIASALQRRVAERAARPSAQRNCAECGADISHRGALARYCESCRADRVRAHDRDRGPEHERRKRESRLVKAT